MDTILLIDLLLTSATLAILIAIISYLGWEINSLHHHGRRIIATITEIRYGIGKSPTGFSQEHPYVTAKWTDPRTGRTYTYWKLAADNKPFYRTGNLVPVLIDPKHPNHYEMEV